MYHDEDNPDAISLVGQNLAAKTHALTAATCW